MLTYEEKNELKDQANTACLTAKELQEIQIKKGYKSMHNSTLKITKLVAPKNFEQRLKEGYKFL